MAAFTLCYREGHGPDISRYLFLGSDSSVEFYGKFNDFIFTLGLKYIVMTYVLEDGITISVYKSGLTSVSKASLNEFLIDLDCDLVVA